jgi:hypothetical protein
MVIFETKACANTFTNKNRIVLYHEGYIRVNIEEFEEGDFDNKYKHISNITAQKYANVTTLMSLNLVGITLVLQLNIWSLSFHLMTCKSICILLEW